MKKVTIRYQRLSDAKRFFEILKNPHFVYFSSNPKSLREEVDWLKQNAKKRREKSEINYTILYDGKIVGAAGLSVYKRPYVAEAGYFVDEEFWGLGIASKALKLLEKEAQKKYGIKRIEVMMDPKNKASEKVAKKCGYTKEGLLKKAVKNRARKLKDHYLYAKILK